MIMFVKHRTVLRLPWTFEIVAETRSGAGVATIISLLVHIS